MRVLHLQSGLRTARKGVSSGVEIGVENGGLLGTFRHLKFSHSRKAAIEAEKCVFDDLDQLNHSEHGYYRDDNDIEPLYLQAAAKKRLRSRRIR